MQVIPDTDKTLGIETDMSAVENIKIEDIKKCISSMDNIKETRANKENTIDSNKTDDKCYGQPDNGITRNDILKESSELNGLPTEDINYEEPQTENTNSELDLNKNNGLINDFDDSSEKGKISEDIDSNNVMSEDIKILADEQINKVLVDNQTTEDIVLNTADNNIHNTENGCVDQELFNDDVNTEGGKSIESENLIETSLKDISIEKESVEMLKKDLIKCKENSIVKDDVDIGAVEDGGQKEIEGYRENIDVDQNSSYVKESVDDEVSTKKIFQETTASVCDNALGTPALMELEDKLIETNDNSCSDKTPLDKNEDRGIHEKQTTCMLEDESDENTGKAENSITAEVGEVIPVNETNDKVTAIKPMNILDDMVDAKVIKVAESSEHTKAAQVERVVAVNETSDKPTTSEPIDLMDGDIEEVTGNTKNCNNSKPAQVEDVTALNETSDKPKIRTPIHVTDGINVAEIVENTKNSINTKRAQVEEIIAINETSCKPIGVLTPIVLKDDLDRKEIIGDTKNSDNTNAAEVTDAVAVNERCDKLAISTPINVTDSSDIAEVIEDAENSNNTELTQAENVIAVNEVSDKPKISTPINVTGSIDAADVIDDTENSKNSKSAQDGDVNPVNETSEKPTTSTPIDVVDDMDIEEVIEDTENSNNTKVEDVIAVNESSDKPTLSTPIGVTSGVKVAEVTKDTENTKNRKPFQDRDCETGEKPTMSTPIDLMDDMDVEEVIDTDIPEKNKEINFDLRESSPATVSDRSTHLIKLKDDEDVQEIVHDNVKTGDISEKEIKQEVPQVTFDTISNDSPICKLSNTLDILSDDEETPEPPKQESKVVTNDKQCINLVDDDDIMMVDDDTNITDKVSNKEENIKVPVDKETNDKPAQDDDDLFAKSDEKETPTVTDSTTELNINEKPPKPIEDTAKPLLPKTFLKTAKTNIADMSREDLEQFCILKIVESIIDRSNLSEIKHKLKTVELSLEETKKKAAMIAKQNRDLQVVLKSVQEEQKKNAPNAPVTPLKITRSVGMQVFMEATNARRKGPASNNQNSNTNRPVRNMHAVGQSPQRPQKSVNNQAIPVPRLVPATSPAVRAPAPIAPAPPKTAGPLPNSVRTPSPTVKAGEKRPHNKSMSVTVDLTGDEPPAKVTNRNTGNVRLVSPQQLMQPQRQPFAVNSPRKVYIPISGQNQNRPGTQAIMLKSVPAPQPGFRPRGPISQLRVTAPITRQQNNRITPNRHPAPLPDSGKQYQPPAWKNLPPAPDLKLSKVENGIVISWKIEGYQEENHEEIASYQLYAYQETSSPPSTSLWKKIGDVKALPLPMACTLTQFMAGFKYYFAVRAVDIKSRLGPFSLPGSILLLNKF